MKDERGIRAKGVLDGQTSPLHPAGTVRRVFRSCGDIGCCVPHRADSGGFRDHQNTPVIVSTGQAHESPLSSLKCVEHSEELNVLYGATIVYCSKGAEGGYTTSNWSRHGRRVTSPSPV